MHWHRSHLHDLSQRSLCILLQWEGASITLSVLARLLHKSSEVTRLAMRPWHEQGIVTMDSSKQGADPVYSLNFRRAHAVHRNVRQALYEHAALGELYFAYGSNMNPARLEARGIPPRFVARAHARGYVLGFPRRMREGGGVAGMLAKANGVVEGVLYLFSDEQFAILDRYEDAPRSYFRTPLTVAVGPSPREQPIVPRLSVITYEAVPGTPAAPTAEYLGHMIAGARFWGLSPATVRTLESVVPLEDEHGGVVTRRYERRTVRRRKRRKR